MGERSMIMRKIMRVVVKNNEFSRDQGKGLREEEGGGTGGGKGRYRGRKEKDKEGDWG